MDRKQKVKLRNLLKEYQKEYCDTAKVAARNWLTDKCDVCDFSDFKRLHGRCYCIEARK